MPVLSLACHLSHNTPHIPSRYNNEQTTKQTKAINNSYIYINISCKCDTNRAGHFTLDAYASRPVACIVHWCHEVIVKESYKKWPSFPNELILHRFGVNHPGFDYEIHGLNLVMFYCGCAPTKFPLILISFTVTFNHIRHGCITGTWAVIIVPVPVK